MLDILNQKSGVKVFLILFCLTALTIVGMQITGNPLKTEAAPSGIISFELIGTLEGSQFIINSWQKGKMTYAGINMGLDFLFLSLYSITIALSCLLISVRLPEHWICFKKLGVWMAVGVIIAALLDIVENIALIKLLLGSENELLPVLAKWCAIPKFLMVLLAIVYVIIGLYPALRKIK
jgi:hypothetical protein